MVIEAYDDIDDFSLPVFKIVLVGPAGAGKSCLMKRYFKQDYEPQSTETTIGVDFKQKLMSIHGNHCKVMIFDTAGQERLRALGSSYYRNANAVMLMFDVTRRDIFDRCVDSWFKEVEDKAPETAVICLTACQTDRLLLSPAERERQKNAQEEIRYQPFLPVSEDESRFAARRHKALYAATSAATGEGINELFVSVIDAYVQRWGLPDPPRHMRRLDLSKSETRKAPGWIAPPPPCCA